MVTGVAVGRAINGIGLNGTEFILEQGGDIKLFKSETEAKGFLVFHGYSKEEAAEFQYVNFAEVEVNGQKRYVEIFHT